MVDTFTIICVTHLLQIGERNRIINCLPIHNIGGSICYFDKVQHEGMNYYEDDDLSLVFIDACILRVNFNDFIVDFLTMKGSMVYGLRGHRSIHIDVVMVVVDFIYLYEKIVIVGEQETVLDRIEIFNRKEKAARRILVKIVLEVVLEGKDQKVTMKGVIDVIDLVLVVSIIDKMTVFMSSSLDSMGLDGNPFFSSYFYTVVDHQVVNI